LLLAFSASYYTTLIPVNKANFEGGIMIQYFEYYGRLTATGMVILAVLTIILLIADGFKLIIALF